MSYIKTPYNMTESEWKRVEDYIEEHYDIYDAIREDMWFDVCDWLARNYNQRGNAPFKCDSISFDSGFAIYLGNFRIKDFDYIVNVYEGYADDYELLVSVNVDKTNNNINDEIRYPMFGNNVIFDVEVYHYDTDGYTEIVDFETQCNISEFENMSMWFAKHNIGRKYAEMMDFMQYTIDDLNTEFEKFETEVNDKFAEWFEMRGTEFRKFLNSYYVFNVEFDDNGDVINIEF